MHSFRRLFWQLRMFPSCTDGILLLLNGICQILLKKNVLLSLAVRNCPKVVNCSLICAFEALLVKYAGSKLEDISIRFFLVQVIRSVWF